MIKVLCFIITVAMGINFASADELLGALIGAALTDNECEESKIVNLSSPCMFEVIDQHGSIVLVNAKIVSEIREVTSSGCSKRKGTIIKTLDGSLWTPSNILKIQKDLKQCKVNKSSRGAT